MMSVSLPEVRKFDNRANDGSGSVLDSNAVEKGLDYSDEKSPSTPGSDDESVHGLTQARSIPWRYKGPAVVCVLLFTLGSNWASSAISPLKNTIRKELKINNSQYGVIASADSLVNTVLPIFSGMAMDYYGAEWGSLICSCFILLGGTIAAIGASTSSYRTLVAGEVVLGIGSTSIETAQSKLYTHWFFGSHLGLVYGIDIAFGRVMNVVSRLTSVPIVNGTGNWAWSFWVAAIMCGVTLVINIAYIVFVYRIPQSLLSSTGYLAKKSGVVSKRFSWFSVVSIPAAFWIIAITQLLQSGTVGSYSSLLADVIRKTRGTTDEIAGYQSSVNQVIPIVLTPLLGGFFDRYGRRMYFVSATAALWVLVFSLLAFTRVHALVPTIFGSLALSFNALPFIASIPLLVPERHLGTAFGIWKAFNNAGSVTMDVSTGAIQDQTEGEGYRNVFLFLIALKAVDVVYGFMYHFIDRKYFAGVLWMNERQRVQKEEEGELEEGKWPLRKDQKVTTYLGVGLLGVMIIIAWVLYLIYSQGS